MYRAACATCARPVIPYLGVYLSDVTFIHQGNPDIMPAAEAQAAGATGRCILLSKFHMLYSVCELIEHYQQETMQVDSKPAILEVFGTFEHQTEERMVLPATCSDAPRVLRCSNSARLPLVALPAWLDRPISQRPSGHVLSLAVPHFTDCPVGPLRAELFKISEFVEPRGAALEDLEV